MKANKLAILLALAVTGLSLQGCLKDSCERKITYTRFDPVYKTFDEIRAGTAVAEAPRPLEIPGALYYYDNKIFIGERSEGIHVIDNSNPENPVATSFIAIPGNESFAIKNGILYASSYIDLLAIDLGEGANVANIQVVGRTENVFPPLWEDLANNRIAISYEETEVTEEVDCSTYGNFYRSESGDFFDIMQPDGFLGRTELLADNSSSGGKADDGTGIGGSMARFTIIGDYLYAIDEWSMDVFSLADPLQPTAASTVEIGWGIETIFPYGDKLFIGSNAGMFIYDNSNPMAPTFLSQFNHASACDPVFVSGNYAYVTLRSGTECQGFTNQLDLIDISNLSSPSLVKSFQMENPHGLSISDENLFLCEGDFGLKSFDISDPTLLGDHLLDHETDLHAFDAISLGGQANLLLVIGKDGFYQYSYDDPADLRFLSKISIGN